MGFVKQEQRRAIETIEPWGVAPPDSVIDHQLLLQTGRRQRELFIGGISLGTGTCSDVRDMNVLVLGFRPVARTLHPVRRQMLAPKDVAADLLPECDYMVLSRDLTAEEYAQAASRRGMYNLSMRGVVALTPVEETPSQLVLAELPYVVDYVPS